MQKENNLHTVLKGKKGNFSGSILIGRNQDILHEQGYGQANRSEQIANETNTRFGIASGCKIFTSTAICQLVEKGVLDFHTPIKDCLPQDLPNFRGDITVHHLLTHTSGVPDYFDEEETDDFEGIWKETPMYTMESPADFLPLFEGMDMKFEPGARFSYCNSGYILLGLIIESLTNGTFTHYVEQNIFQPCGMKDSGYFRMDQLPERTAFGYIEGSSGWKTNIYSVPVKGGADGGAFTTVYDMDRFWSGLLEGKLLGDEYRDRLLTPHVHSHEQVYYGYGVWILMENQKPRKFLVMGYDPGVRMHSSVNVETSIRTHILSNSEQDLYPIVQEVDRFYNEKR